MAREFFIGISSREIFSEVPAEEFGGRQLLAQGFTGPSDK
jgi:hypothetical protein